MDPVGTLLASVVVGFSPFYFSGREEINMRVVPCGIRRNEIQPRSNNQARTSQGVAERLFHMREAGRAVRNPVSSWADSMSQLYSNPYSPLAYMPFAKRMSAGFELVHRLGKEYEKPAFGL